MLSLAASAAAHYGIASSAVKNGVAMGSLLHFVLHPVCTCAVVGSGCYCTCVALCGCGMQTAVCRHAFHPACVLVSAALNPLLSEHLGVETLG